MQPSLAEKVPRFDSKIMPVPFWQFHLSCTILGAALMAAPDGDIGLQLVLDQPGGHDDGPIADDDPWAKFTLPFPVGTIEDLEQRCYFNEEGLPEWLWSRAHAFLHISSEGWRYLHLNQAKIKQHFVNCQIDVGEFRYRPKEGSEHICKWKDHTFMSRGLLAMLLFIQASVTTDKEH